LAAALLEQTGIEPELIAGDHGVFDVLVDGELVYSKSESGEFPADEQVVQLIRGRRG
jgi:selenoprotein W-related protein